MLRKITDRFAETEIDDEVVLMDIDSGKFFALKGTGLAIWQRIDGTTDAAAITRTLTDEYAVDPAICAAEVDRFVEQMAGAGFVEHS